MGSNWLVKYLWFGDRGRESRQGCVGLVNFSGRTITSPLALTALTFTSWDRHGQRRANRAVYYLHVWGLTPAQAIDIDKPWQDTSIVGRSEPCLCHEAQGLAGPIVGRNAARILASLAIISIHVHT